MTKELDVVEFLKLTRECKALIKVSVSREDRLNYIKPARMKFVSSDDGKQSGDERISAKVTNRTNDSFKSSVIPLD